MHRGVPGMIRQPKSADTAGKELDDRWVEMLGRSSMPHGCHALYALNETAAR
jgi:hypothetical protein